MVNYVTCVDKEEDYDLTECVMALDAQPILPIELKIQDLDKEVSNVEEVPKLKLKPLPYTLKYGFLGEDNAYPIILNSLMSKLEEKLLRVLREYRFAIGWTIMDVKGVSPAIYMHKILMEDNCNPVG